MFAGSLASNLVGIGEAVGGVGGTGNALAVAAAGGAEADVAALVNYLSPSLRLT